MKEHGAQVEVTGLNKDLQAREDVDTLFLWCTMCALNVGVFSAHGVDKKEFIEVGHKHVLSKGHIKNIYKSIVKK